MKALFSRRKAGPSQSTPPPEVAPHAKNGKENRPVASTSPPDDDHNAGPSTASVQRRPSSKASYRSRFSSLAGRRPAASHEPVTDSQQGSHLDRPPSRLSVRLAESSRSSYQHAEPSLEEANALRDTEGEHAGGDHRRVKFDSTILPNSASTSTTSANAPSRQQQRPRPVSMHLDFVPSLPSGDRSASQASTAGSTRRKFSLPPLSSLRPAPRPPSAVSSSRTSPTKSLLCPAPSEGSLRAASTTGYLPQAQSWSDMVGDDLVANLGPKERARQEVLWEIVSSEERYVQELVKLNDTFCRALLPPSFYSPSLDAPRSMSALSRALSPTESAAGSSFSPTSSRSNSFDQLPIAAQYSSKRYSTGSRNVSDTSASSALASVTEEESRASSSAYQQGRLRGGQREAYEALTHGRPTDNAALRAGSSGDTSRKQRAHMSLPPTQTFAANGARIPQAISTSISGRSFLSRRGSGSRTASRSSRGSLTDEADVLPPEILGDLRKVLEVLAGGILQGHLKLAKALRKRFDDQYPLVRSLADVFHAHASILREYATYVLHLEAALSQADLLLTHAQTASTSRRHSKTLASHPSGKLSMLLLSLEELAADRGESGLIISLSKPFQRLLKYPLLFQNLLFNTDPSMKEYERTLDMVDEVEQIVRGIEDEKVDYEEKERTRDAWARIDGLEGGMALVVPRPHRLLVSELQVDAAEEVPEPVKQHKSFRRLSELFNHPEQEDHWLVRFTDVTLLCQRTGTTSLPISSRRSSTRSSEDDLSEMPFKTARSRRTISIKPRNLYRFIKVAEWHIPDKELPAIVTPRDQKELPPVPVGRVSQDFEGIDTASCPAEELVGGPTADQGIAITTDEPATPRRAARSSAAPLSLQETPRRRVALKLSDGPSPSRTPRAGRDSDNATLVSDRLSVMSFAYQTGDHIRPVRPVQPLKVRPKSAVQPDETTTLRPSRAISATPSAVAAQPKRLSAGHLTGKAADAKFANRLRVASSANADDSTVRPASRGVRSSLPPAMLQRPRPASTMSSTTPTPGAQASLQAASSGKTVRIKTAALASARTAERGSPLPPWNVGSGLAPRISTTLGTKVVPLMGPTPDRKSRGTDETDASSPVASRGMASRNLGGRI